jgi:hypothetical protein
MVHPTKPTAAAAIEGIAPDWQSTANDFADYLSQCCAPPSNEPTEVWAEKHVVIQEGPFAGSNWRLMFTPFAKFIFESFRNPRRKRHTIMMSAQYVKTMALIIDFLRNAKEDPAPAMWVMAEADNMDEFVTKRLVPYIEACDVVAPLFVGGRKGLIQLDSMNLMLRGSSSRAKLQSDPVRRVYCDERREWKKGAIDLLRKRMRTYPNAVEISAGTAGVENDELHQDYLEGTQTRAHIRCLVCNHSQPIRFGREATTLWKTPRECGGFVWETSDKTKPDGVWDEEAVRASVEFECENPACKARYKNAQKYELLRTMHTHDYNPKASPENASFGGSAFEAIWESCDWDRLVWEFLKAVEAAKTGNVEPLRAFITETLGEPWADAIGVIEDFGFLEARKADYDFGERWPDEVDRIMAADKQAKGGEHYWWLVRAFNRFGGSRLIAYGKVNTFAELEEKRKEHGVKAVNAILDTGFKASECYRFCLATGWKAFKGEANAEYFLHKEEKSGKMMRRIWDRTFVDPFMGTNKQGQYKPLPLFRWCGDATKDLLAEYMMGLVGDWSIPRKVERLYFKHLSADKREEVLDSRNRMRMVWKQVLVDNHLKDCEEMVTVAAVIKKLITPRPIVKLSPPLVAKTA